MTRTKDILNFFQSVLEYRKRALCNTSIEDVVVFPDDSVENEGKMYIRIAWLDQYEQKRVLGNDYVLRDELDLYGDELFCLYK